MPTIKQLERYAEVLIRVGLNIQPGQPVSIRTPIEAAEFVRMLVAKAYEAGALTVHVDWHDPETGRIRLLQESEEALVHVPTWLVQKSAELCHDNTAFLHIDAENPDLLADIDPRRIAMAAKARNMALKEVNKNFMEDRVSWLVCSIPTKAWAMKLFPGEPEDTAVEKLWDTIFKTMRMDETDPVSAWNEHLDRLETRAAFLNDRRFARLSYQARGTDLTVDRKSVV